MDTWTYIIIFLWAVAGGLAVEVIKGYVENKKQ